MTSDDVYGWRTIPESLRDLPIVFLDVDGTVRGDVLPMVKLAQPLVPDFFGKALYHRSIHFRKLCHFLWDLGKLWTLRTIHSEQRRRYKYLFSELHILAASLLRDSRLADVRQQYREYLGGMQGLWFDGAVELLRRLTRWAVVVLVTGSEQLQTEQCVRLLAEQGLDISRVFVNGSLYGYDPATGRFTGRVQQLNVTCEGKEDVVRYYVDRQGNEVVGAVGNSRPDRALFDAVVPTGMRVLVCHPAVFQQRKADSFVIRRLSLTGYQLYWEASEFVAAVQEATSAEPNQRRPVLATDASFANVLTSQALSDRYPWLAH